VHQLVSGADNKSR